MEPVPLLIALAGAAPPRPRRAFTKADHRGIRACATRQIRRPWKRSSRSCVRPAMIPTVCGCAIVVLWRAGLRISEALALSESDLDPRVGVHGVREFVAFADGGGFDLLAAS
jgi:integrase